MLTHHVIRVREAKVSAPSARSVTCCYCVWHANRPVLVCAPAMASVRSLTRGRTGVPA
jgi:hypothetical protein